MLTYDDYRPTRPDRSRWTLPDVLAWRAETHGDRIYLDVPGEGVAYRYREVHDLARRIASGLLARGHRPGDRILIIAPNCSRYVLAWLGTGLAGIAEVPINTAYKGAFLEHQVRTVEPSGVVVAADLVNRLLDLGGPGAWAAAATAGPLPAVSGPASPDPGAPAPNGAAPPRGGGALRCYVVPTPPGGSLGGSPSAPAPTPPAAPPATPSAPGGVDEAVESLRRAGFPAEPFDALLAGEPGPLPEVKPRDLASVFFTSGTTGPSKGVMMSHSHMVFEADECISLTRLTDADTYLSVGPLFHGNAQFLAAYPALLAGARFVLRERFSASSWLDWVRDSGATVTNFVGVMMDFVFKQPPRRDDADNSLRCIFAAPTASSILEAFKARFGVEAFVEVFGLTETAMPIMTPYGTPRPPGAAGLLVADMFDVRLVDPETDEEVATGELGELVVRTRHPYTMCSGYFAMPDKTADAMRNLWFHTGDGLRRDEDGWYYFVDRLKDAIRRRGENISSYEVEQALLAHPGVAECAVVAVPAEQEAGEDEVLAAVVAVPGAAPSPEELWAFCDERLPYFAVPRFLAFVDELPMTPSGKIQKAEIRRGAGGAPLLDRIAVLGSMPARG